MATYHSILLLGFFANVIVSGSSYLESQALLSCPSSRYSIAHYRRPKFSTCARNHFNLVSDEGSGIWPYRQYASSNARPPQLKINRTDDVLAPGLIFITPAEYRPSVGYELPAAFIFNDGGDLIWSSGTGAPDQMIANLRTQLVSSGESVISYWNGTNAGTHGFGKVEVLNDRYEKIYSVCPKLNIAAPSQSGVECFVDQHEAVLTSDDTMLVTVYNTTPTDLTAIGGPDHGFVLDSIVVEVDIKTNQPVWVWNPLKHVPVQDSRLSFEHAGWNMSNPFDYFHTNAVQPWKNGFLINSRHTWAAYYVSRSGDIKWRVEGVTGGDFGTLPYGGRFSWQHDARLNERSEREVELTMFANNEESDHDAAKASIALSLILELPPVKAKPVELLKNLSDPLQPVSTRAGGSNTLLPNGNHFVGYGKHPIIKEFGPEPRDGSRVKWSAQFAHNIESYRAYKQEWHATPSFPIALAMGTIDPTHDRLAYCDGGSIRRGYISWNGATDVIRYAIYVDSGDGVMRKSFTIPRLGYETEFVVPEHAARVQVGAIECFAKGEVGRSRVVPVVLGAQISDSDFLRSEAYD